MRRRRQINVWPAFADLMTVLAVVGLFSAIEMRQSWAEMSENWARERESYEEKIQNEELFDAVQQVQEVINEISKDASLDFGPDQSLHFGDDLVDFDRNSVEPQWKEDGAERLRRFCVLVSQGMKNHVQLFTVQVEGHTDDTQCSVDPNCNWWFSSNRATTFMEFMRSDEYCPGGRAWELRAIGYADTKPLPSALGAAAKATRRIAVRLVPDYETILKSRDGSGDVGDVSNENWP